MKLKFNHLNVKAKPDSDLQRLFTQVLGLNLGSRPTFSFPGQWLYQNHEALVHVIEEDVHDPILGHIAFDLDGELTPLLSLLAANGFTPEIRQVPNSNIVQVFVGTGGLLIELIIQSNTTLYKFAAFSRHEEL